VGYYLQKASAAATILRIRKGAGSAWFTFARICALLTWERRVANADPCDEPTRNTFGEPIAFSYLFWALDLPNGA
jgi:hypothetical protein